MGCGEGLSKTLLIVANLACVLVGIAFIAVGVVGRVNIDKVHEAIPDDISTTGTFNVLIALGALVFIIAFLGCCGSCKSNVCMLNTYGTILIVIFLAQVALGIYAFVKIKDTNELRTKITNKVDKLVQNYQQHNTPMDSIQEVIQCCGANSAADYASLGIAIPKSCYKDQDTQAEKLYSEGCGQKISDLLTKSTRILAIVAITVSAVEVFGAIFAFGLASCIKDRKRTY